MSTDIKQQRYRGRFIILRDEVEIRWGAKLIDRVILRCLIFMLRKKPALARDPEDCTIGLLWWKAEDDYLYLLVTDNPHAGDTEIEEKMAFA